MTDMIDLAKSILGVPDAPDTASNVIDMAQAGVGKRAPRPDPSRTFLVDLMSLIMRRLRNAPDPEQLAGRDCIMRAVRPTGSRIGLSDETSFITVRFTDPENGRGYTLTLRPE